MRAVKLVFAVVFLVAASHSVYASNGGYSQCFTPEKLLACKAKLDTLGKCPSGMTILQLLNHFDKRECCFDCQPCVNMPTSLPPCEITMKRGMGVDVLTQLYDSTTYCPKCDLSQLKLDRSHIFPAEQCLFFNLSACESGEVPTFDDKGCPSCRPPLPDCRKSSCANVPACSDGVLPVLNPSTCCPSCKLSSSLVERVKNTCLPKLKQCGLSLGSKPTCAADRVPSFSENTCCVDCIPAALPRRPGGGVGKCLAKEIKKCLGLVPACADQDVATFLPSACCKMCRRPEWRCSPCEVAQCLKKTGRTCEDNEIPQHVEGQCCPTCLPAPPKCTPPCEDNELCIGRGSTAAPVCRNITEIRLKLNIPLAASAFRNRLRAFSPEEFKSFLLEIFERFCDIPENEAKCDAVRVQLQNMVVAAKSVGQFVKMLLKMTNGPVDAAGQELRVLSTAHSPADVLTDSLNDPVAQSGDSEEVFTATPFEGDVGAATHIFAPHWIMLVFTSVFAWAFM